MSMLVPEEFPDQALEEIGHSDHKASRSCVLVIMRVSKKSIFLEGNRPISGRDTFPEETYFPKGHVSRSVVLPKGTCF